MSDIRILYSYNLRWTTIFFLIMVFTSYMISLGSLMDHKVKLLDFLPFSAPEFTLGCVFSSIQRKYLYCHGWPTSDLGAQYIEWSYESI